MNEVHVNVHVHVMNCVYKEELTRLEQFNDETLDLHMNGRSKMAKKIAYKGQLLAKVCVECVPSSKIKDHARVPA